MNISVIIFFLFIIVALVISIWLNFAIKKGGGGNYFAETDAELQLQVIPDSYSKSTKNVTKTVKKIYFHAKKLDDSNTKFWYDFASKTQFTKGTGDNAVQSFKEVLALPSHCLCKYVCYISEIRNPIDDTVSHYNSENHNILMVTTVVTNTDSLIMSPMGIFKNAKHVPQYGGLSPYLQVFAAKVMLIVNPKLINGYMLTTPMMVMKEILRKIFLKDSYADCIRQEHMQRFKEHVQNGVNTEWYKWVKEINGDIKEKINIFASDRGKDINKEIDLDSLYNNIIIYGDKNYSDIQNAWKSHLYTTSIDYVKYMKQADELESKKDEIISNVKKAWEEQKIKYKTLEQTTKKRCRYSEFPENDLRDFALQYSKEKFGSTIHFTDNTGDLSIYAFTNTALINYFIETDYLALYKFYKEYFIIAYNIPNGGDSWMFPNVICTEKDLVVIKPDTEEILIKINQEPHKVPRTLDSLENYEKYNWLIDSTYKPKGGTSWFSIPVKKLTEYYGFQVLVSQ